MAEIIITDDNFGAHMPTDDRSGGLIARDFASHPHGSLAYAKPFDLPLIPREEWNERLADLKAAKATLLDIRGRAMNGQRMPSLDQNGKGYCWAHSSTNCVRYVRAVNHQPYADLSAYSVACKIKRFRDQGGWAGESMEFIAQNGVATSQFWPQRSMDRSNDNPTTWADAAKYIVEEWMDLDPEQMEDQWVTCTLLGIPVASDYDFWGHSVCGIGVDAFVGTGRNTRVDTSIIDNSWGDQWGDNGVGKLKGRKAIPNSAIAPRVVRATA